MWPPLPFGDGFVAAARSAILVWDRRERAAAERWESLREPAVDWDEAQCIRAFLNALESRLQVAADGVVLCEGLAWAWRNVEALDPLSDVDAGPVRQLLHRPRRRRLPVAD